MGLLYKHIQGGDFKWNGAYYYGFGNRIFTKSKNFNFFRNKWFGVRREGATLTREGVFSCALRLLLKFVCIFLGLNFFIDS